MIIMISSWSVESSIPLSIHYEHRSYSIHILLIPHLIHYIQIILIICYRLYIPFNFANIPWISSADLLRQPMLSISKLSSSQVLEASSKEFRAPDGRSAFCVARVDKNGDWHGAFVMSLLNLGKPKEHDHFYICGSELVDLPPIYGRLNREIDKNPGYARSCSGRERILGNSLRTVPVV